MTSTKNIRASFSLPMQLLVSFILLLELAILCFILYIVKDFKFRIDDATSVWGWIIIIVSTVFSGWNIVSYFHRNKMIKNAQDNDQKLQAFKSATFSRYITLLVISVVSLVFTFITKNIYFLFFFAFSFVWQVSMFPSRAKIAYAIKAEEEPAAMPTEPDKEQQPENGQQTTIVSE